MANREIEAILKISSKLGSMRALKTLQKEIGKVDSQAKKFNRSQAMVTKATNGALMASARYLAPAAVAIGVKRAIVSFAEIERRMTRIGITAEASAKDTTAAFQVIQQRAKEFALPIDEAVNALDTLVSSGLDLQEALAFLPSVLATAQATGASTEDIANTAIKASSALQIQSKDMQKAFDIMVAGGKAGQFELKDMAAYIPELANSFASLGYHGTDGLKTLVAVLQTIREDTGSASAAATDAQNIFGKMYSEETARRFKKLGIKDLRKSLAEAAASGEDVLQAFVRLSKEAIHGDLSKLPLLFTDQQFRLGMQSLMTSPESYERFVDAVNNKKVDGSTLRDLNVVLDGTKTKIDRLGDSWDHLWNSLSAAASGPVGGGMDWFSDKIDYDMAVNAGLEQSGVHGFAARTWWGITHGEDAKNGMAWRGGRRTKEERTAIKQYGLYSASRREAAAAPVISPPVDKDIFGMPVNGPLPTSRPDRNVRPSLTYPNTVPDSLVSPVEKVRNRTSDVIYGGMKEANDIQVKMLDATPFNPIGDLEARLEDASRKASSDVSSAGENAGRSIEDAARSLNEQGASAGQTFARMVQGVGRQIGIEAATSFKENIGSLKVNINQSGLSQRATGNPGRSMPNAGRLPGPV